MKLNVSFALIPSSQIFLFVKYRQGIRSFGKLAYKLGGEPNPAGYWSFRTKRRHQSDVLTERRRKRLTSCAEKGIRVLILPIGKKRGRVRM